MSYLFLEDGDLLEATELECTLEEVLTEASLYGMKITKENLEDEEFVKELVNKIKSNKHTTRSNVSMWLMIIGLISVVTIVGAPIGLLLIAITKVIKSGYEIQEKELKKVDDCFEKTINKLKQKMNKSKDKDEIEKLKDIIKKLEDNREHIYERKAKEAIQQRLKKVIDFSKYGNHGIKVGSTEIISHIGDIDPMNFAKKYNNEKEIKSEFTKSTKLPFNKIEEFYANGIKSRDDLIKLIKSKGKAYNGTDFMGGEKTYKSYGPTVIKYLKDKQVVELLSDVHDTCILYSFDDDCCYDWVGEESDVITKISVKDFLQASKTAYEDLVKIYKEFK